MAIITEKRTWSHHTIIPALIGLAICYSITYNYFLLDAVPNEVNDDASCAAIPGNDESPHCSEVRLFRSWHDADGMIEESDESLLAESPSASGIGEQSSTSDALEETLLSVNKQSHEPVDGAAMEADAAAAAEEKRVQIQQARERREKFDELEAKVRASLNQENSETPFAKHLKELQERMEAKGAELKRHHDDMVLTHWQADVDQLDSKIREALHADATVTWEAELATMKGLLQAHIGVNASASLGHDDEVFALRHTQLDKLEEALHEDPSSQFSAPWAKLGSFAFEIKHMRARLELEMSTHKTSQHSSTHPAHMAHRTDIAEEIVDRATTLASSLTDLVSHHKDWETKLPTSDAPAATPHGTKLPTSDAPAATSHGSNSGSGLRGARGKQRASDGMSTTPKPSTSFMEKRLQWSSITKLSQSVITGAAHDIKTLVSKSELRHLHWDGAIPKVACITAISYSSHTKARMMYFIDNFKLQHYEGPKQLVIVYHHSDTQAAQLVQKYADGVDIKGVAARDGKRFPSNAALRYGAWSASADVVVQWEFDEWHDPKRLSMQVRAMAFASKPACVLQSASDQSHTTKDQEAVVQDTSLAGERTWMKAYWQPFSEQDGATMVRPPPAHLVELSMSIAQPKKDESRSVPQTQKDESQHKPVSSLRASTTQAAAISVMPQMETKAEGKAVHEWTMKECLDLDTNTTGLAVNTEEAVSKNLGDAMGKTFHKLTAKRRDITQRLVLLCIESTMKSDMQEHIFKRQHVEQMLGIRNELDKHMSALHSMLATSS